MARKYELVPTPVIHWKDINKDFELLLIRIRIPIQMVWIRNTIFKNPPVCLEGTAKFLQNAELHSMYFLFSTRRQWASELFSIPHHSPGNRKSWKFPASEHTFMSHLVPCYFIGMNY
jgi:hypothetical protein